MTNANKKAENRKYRFLHFKGKSVVYLWLFILKRLIKSSLPQVKWLEAGTVISLVLFSFVCGN